MPEKFALQQRICNRRTVDHDKGLTPVGAVEVNRFGHKLFTGPALPLNQNIGPCIRDRTDEFEHLSHLRGTADNIIDSVFLLLFLDEITDFILQTLHLKRFVDRQIQFHIVQRFDEIFEGSQLYGFHSCFHIIKSRDDDDIRILVLLAYLVQDFKTTYVGKTNVQHDQIWHVLIKLLKASFSVFSQAHFIVPRKMSRQSFPDQFIIIDDQDGSHCGSSTGIRISNEVPFSALSLS